MRLTVLGTGTIAFSTDRSCSGYYVEAGSAKILMDCGSGTTRRVAELGIPWQEITHVALTHFHIDHHGDLPTLIFAWKYGQLPPRATPLDIIGPVGTLDLLTRLTGAHGEWVTAPGYTIRVTELDPGASMDLGGATLSCTKVPHTPESVAYSITEGSHRLVYSGDTGVSPELAEWARGSDLLVLECSLPTSMAIVEHLTPEQCGEMARLAEPRQLVLTHLYPPVEAMDIPALVGTSFTGPVVVAHDGYRAELKD
jgi:ribonuclease BN (tRNA processing enzyme)